MAINDEDATLDAPPQSLLEKLIPSKNGTINPFKQRQSAPKASTSNSPNPPTSHSSPSIYPPYSYYGPYGPHYPPIYPHQLPTTPTSTGMIAMPNTSMIPNQNVPSTNDNDVRSSPPMQQDPVERMINYINWLARISPTQASMLIEAKEILVSKGYIFRTLPQIFDEKFAKMEIEDGVVPSLRTEIKAFKKAEARGVLLEL